ncbi:efflux RND transporter periplasmic adaptor subunit [Asticcacaulis machinosus]|uniref:Efflux RND transporter periplasmic adaptor subunit n=1 Tax=Asticcacaulis machinosus TaxID=2984211 RepID=A0ABT5HJJ7_9CAUL|nr:efflux RND transporter periplasmic adaptor subunit [Asticcacaulis machinosus]MDC7676331.1 efflux RND transporter periplasmic adaptor subunit [Asticcacaulis machinosus]
MIKPAPLAIAAGVVVVAAAAFFLWPKGESDDKGKGRPPVPVVTVRAETRTIAHDLKVVGSVTSLNSVTLRPQVDGVLTQVLFDEGAFVQKGQLLAVIDDRTYKAALQSAQAQLATNKSRLLVAETDLKRYQTLAEINAIPQQTLDQQKAAVEQAKAAVQMDEAAVENARVQLSFTRITSPVSGRIGIRRVDPGNLVSASSTEGLATVTQINPISVVFSVPQTVQGDLIEGMKRSGGITVKAVDREKGEVLATGRISALDNVVQAGTGTVQIRATFDNGGEKLWPGQFVVADISLNESTNALTLPTVAVRPGLEGPFVIKIVADKAQIVPVETAYQNDDYVVVTKGVAAGEEIVTDGHSRLQPDAPVKRVKPGGEDIAAKGAAPAKGAQPQGAK